jgi:hypothetical protein
MAGAAERLGKVRVRAEARDFGYAVAAPGHITPDGARLWAEELKRVVERGGRREFGVLLDARRQPVQPPATGAVLQEAMVWLRAHGARRSAVVADDAVVLLQARRLAAEAGTGALERYIDVRRTPDWERAAREWIAHGVEPEERRE